MRVLALAITPHLTYKSIREAIQSHEGRTLFCLPSALLGEETPRTVFVSNELHEIVNGPPWPATWEGRRHANLRALFDGFTEGDWITVAENPFDKNSRAILARVAPPEDEIWDFRCLDPRPGIRAFGRFSEPNTFIALTWNYREIVDWSHEVKKVQGRMAEAFLPASTFHGKDCR
jgi:hypothetical protein